MSAGELEEVELTVTELLLSRGRKYGAYNAHQLYGHVRAEPAGALPLRVTIASPGTPAMLGELLAQLGQAVSAGIEAVETNGRVPSDRADSVPTERQVGSGPSPSTAFGAGPSTSLRTGLASAPSGPPPDIDEF